MHGHLKLRCSSLTAEEMERAIKFTVQQPACPNGYIYGERKTSADIDTFPHTLTWQCCTLCGTNDENENPPRMFQKETMSEKVYTV